MATIVSHILALLVWTWREWNRRVAVFILAMETATLMLTLLWRLRSNSLQKNCDAGSPLSFAIWPGREITGRGVSRSVCPVALQRGTVCIYANTSKAPPVAVWAAAWPPPVGLFLQLCSQLRQKPDSEVCLLDRSQERTRVGHSGGCFVQRIAISGGCIRIGRKVRPHHTDQTIHLARHIAPTRVALYRPPHGAHWEFSPLEQHFRRRRDCGADGLHCPSELLWGMHSAAFTASATN